ncbi:hypothetical protein ANO11243_042420 [Dothideomycetidae sp. 11243]|nr:hypothetical protein ANO11243_042420 [fungal sp. No.11243]
MVDGQYDVTSFKTMPPTYHSTYSGIGGLLCPWYQGISASSDVITLYGTNQVSCNEIEVNHKFYFHAPYSGTYGLYFPAPDDRAFLWVGSTAYSGWTEDNVVTSATYGTGKQMFMFSAVAGSYTPIRVNWGNRNDAGHFDLAIYAPDGSTLLSSNTPYSSTVVQYSCDGVTAPPFPAWGSET